MPTTSSGEEGLRALQFSSADDEALFNPRFRDLYDQLAKEHRANFIKTQLLDVTREERDRWRNLAQKRERDLVAIVVPAALLIVALLAVLAGVTL
jgi:hypothetical protein